MSIAVIDDDPSDIDLLERRFARVEGGRFDVQGFSVVAEALAALREGAFEALMVDFQLGATTGIALIESLRAEGDERPMILLTGVGDEELAVEALQRGADDYLNKNRLDAETLRRSLSRAMAQSRLRCEKSRAEKALLASEEKYRRLADELAEANRRLSQLVTEDALTGLANRRHFDALLRSELRRARRKGDPVALLFCDVDYFKQYNDHFGHPAGDACLKAVGEALRTLFLRAGDLPARYGGEEFTVILPGMAEEEAFGVAERVRQAVAALRIPQVRPDGLPHVTLSVGVAVARGRDGRDAAWLVTHADEALLESKRRGRNRSTLADIPDTCCVES